MAARVSVAVERRTATAILSSEHRVIERALDVLDLMAERFTADRAVHRADAAAAVDFLRTFADRCHHGKEEANLFPRMEAAGLPPQGPTAVMRAEHDEGRALVRAMEAAAGREDPVGFADAARRFSFLLREHIRKEDEVLFPMADRMLDAAAQAELLDAFARVEHDDLGPGTHERMLGILDGLGARYGAPPRSAGCGCSCGGG